MNQDYFTWCLSRLTPHQFCVYQACLYLYIGKDSHISIKAISEICSITTETVRVHMAELQKRKFIQYYTVAGAGTTLVWVRQSCMDKPLSAYLLKKTKSIALTSPEGELFQVEHGKVRAFCREKNLSRRGLYDLLEGYRNSHRGWTA
jgi:predicted transcriptional regulator